jgi:hypothetical protein
MTRWSSHVYASKDPVDRRWHMAFHAAIRKYGPESFDHEILDVVKTRRGANVAEALWIERKNSRVPSGYNIDAGAAGYRDMSEDTRRKMRECRTAEEWRANALRVAASLSPERRREKALKGAASQTPEQRRNKALKAAAAQTSEQRSRKASKRWSGMTDAERSEWRKRAFAHVPREVYVEAARKRWEKIRAEMSAEQRASIESRKPRPGKASESKRKWWADLSPERRAEIRSIFSAAQRKYRDEHPGHGRRKSSPGPRTSVTIKGWETRRRRASERAAKRFLLLIGKTKFRALTKRIANAPVDYDAIGYGC